MDDINLDFLKTPPKQSQPVARTPSPFVYNGLDVRFGKKKLGSRKFEMAQSIAKVDELVQEIDKIRSQNNELQLRLKDFQKTAQQVQDLYSKEKREHTIAKQYLEKLQTEYKKIDVDLTNKTMVNDQIKARLAEYEGRPINFNNLVVKYVKIMNKLEGEDILKYSSDKDLVERLREYCAATKLKIPPVNSPRKHKTRGHKVKTQESFVQCNLLEDISSLQKETCVSSTKKPKMQDQNIQCSLQNQDWLSSTKKECLICTKKPKMHDQNTQCSSTTKRDQASQYISTMITRQTNTEKIIQKHVQTMFPEPQKMPAIDDILNVYSRWSNIRSVSPLLESPSRIRKDISTKTTSTGTCTMLCNIRRKIDYLPPNSSSNIKQEIVTPSASPTPTSNPILTNRARVSSHSNNVSNSNINPSQFSSSILNIFNANTNSALGQLSSNAFNELWQIFGKMLLSLLQSSNAGIAQSNQNSGINQQQFLDWLLELYMSSQPQNTASTQTQTLEQMDSTGSRSPICFNESSMLSTNVVRPEAQKTLPARTNTEEDETGDLLRAESSIDNNTHRIYQRSVAISPIPTSCTSNFPLEIYSQDSNSMDREVQQIQIASNITELQTRCMNESTLNELQPENTLKEDTKASNKRKSKHKLLDQIQELIPEVNLNKKKRKALKRLLKNNNPHKNSYETRKTQQLNDFKNNSSIVLLPNETDNDETIENAVDFLKTFAVTQEENFSETEKIFLEQSSIEMVDERIIENKNVYKSDDEFTFIKPSGIPRTKHASATSKDVFLKPTTKSTTKRKQSKTSKTKQIENKYQLLFGDSDSEFEEQEMEMENSKSVIKTQLNLSEGNNNCNNINESTNLGIVNTTNFKQNKYSEDTNSNEGNSWNQTCHLTIRDPLQNELSLPIIPTPVFENCCDSDYSYDRFSIPDLPTPLLKRLECTHLPDMEQFEETKDFNYLQSAADSNNYVDSNIEVCENNIENDLELSSDDSCCHGDVNEFNDTLPKTDSNKQIEVPTISQNNTNNFNKNPSGCLLEQTQVIGTQTNEEFCTNTIAKLKETFITAKHLVSKIELNVEKCIKTLPNLNDYDDEENCSNDSIDRAEFCTEHTYPSDFEKDLELSSDNESVISQCDQINTQTIEETEEKDYEFPNSFKTCTSNSIIESREDINSFATDNEERSKNVAETKDNLLEKDINSCSNESNIINLQQRTDNNFEAITKLSVEVKNSSTTKTIPSNLEQSHSSKNKTANEENSLCWSIITVSESSINDETLNNEEITKTLETKSNNEVDTKTNGLSCLKLLDLNSIHRHLKESSNVMTNTTTINTKPNSSNVKQVRKSENEMNLFCSPANKDIKYHNISVQNNALRKENDANLPCSSIKADLKTNGNRDDNEVINISEDYSSMEEECGLKSKEVNLITGFENDLIINKTYTNLTETEMNCNLETPVLKQDLYLSIENDESILNKDLISDKPIDTEDETDFNDSLSLDNELLIDEEPNYTSAKESETEDLNSTKQSEISCESCDDTINSSNISCLLNSTLYNEVLTESLNPIVDDLLKNDMLKKSLTTEENKPKRGRKRKSECLAEVVLPCKRSQRLKAKQIILEESINLSKTPIKLGKYTKIRKNLNNIQLNSPCNENIKDSNLKMKCEIAENNETLGNEAPLQMGFFRERLTKDLKEVEPNNHQQSTIAKTNQSGYKSEVISNNILNDAKILDDINELSLKNQTTPEFIVADNPSNNSISNKPTDYFVYTDSPQSPPPLETHQEFLNETFIVIPQERLPKFVPQQYNVTLFDALITNYRTENQKHVLESITTKERQHQENILNQYDKQLKSFCYSEMELDPNCTSIQLINQLLSISPDYSLIQKALITVAQKAEGTNVNENDLPSIIQEMPPRHLSKCLQRLFAVLRNFITRNSNFCLDLIDKIELLLFNWKQTENLSLQATLNVTQLYLMACKVQEYVQLPKHPARLFIAKCLYFYLQKSTLMIHEVLMWYPTVLPHREDKTYDRSDALISVLQHILMTTKYEMEKPDLRGKTLLSKLRYEYHFEPFKPALDEVINVLVEKLKNSKFYNISLAYGLLCKRLGVPRTQHIVLIQHLLPLANEYYNLALTTEDYDKRIAVLLEIISMIVKPFPIETDTKLYFNEFARFLNAFDRQLIQEAALCSILRLQRFNMEYCFKLLRHFQPTYDLNPHTQAMLKTFLHRRPLTYWKNLKSQNPTNLI
ncbi:little elongation complex subunit 1 [Calliphora vicina]|uniref:little elongation complex subunit 1 n=1 Tax=Calliphora vicina TaxID=7373 RepID=UPI00325B4221